MDGQDERRSVLRAAGLFRAEWLVLGPLGRTALLALVLSAFVAVLLALWIPYRVERSLLASTSASLERVIDDLVASEGIPSSPVPAASLDQLDAAVRRRMLGRETVRVKIWSDDGTILYSDAPELIDETYPLSAELAAAFAGELVIRSPEVDRPENAAERDLGPLYEYYVPIRRSDGSVTAVFEAYERADPFVATVVSIRRYVWGSIAGGIGFLAIFIVILFVRNAIVVTRGRRQAEQLLADLVHAQEEERRRVVGSLHDDVGQPLYRIHYGIQDCRARVAPGSAIDDELARIGTLVHAVDEKLRSELRTLREEPGVELDLAHAITELAEVTEMETDLQVTVRAVDGNSLPLGHRMSLYRAAQESITNVRRHARAATVSMDLHRQGDAIVLDVADDGVGASAPAGLGLIATRDRLEALGGGLELALRQEGGTRFRAWVPAVDGRGSRA